MQRALLSCSAKLQLCSLGSGVGPADSTGKSSVRCCPGGTRSAWAPCACGRESRAKLGVAHGGYSNGLIDRHTLNSMSHDNTAMHMRSPGSQRPNKTSIRNAVGCNRMAMLTFTVHEPPNPPADRDRRGRTSWCSSRTASAWLAALFAPLWMLVHRLWWALLELLVADRGGLQV